LQHAFTSSNAAKGLCTTDKILLLVYKCSLHDRQNTFDSLQKYFVLHTMSITLLHGVSWWSKVGEVFWCLKDFAIAELIQLIFSSCESWFWQYIQ